MRFNSTNHLSLNKSIAKVQNPHQTLDEALEYTAALESVILSVCEELDLDPDKLVEDVMTAARERELKKKITAQGKKTQAAYYHSPPSHHGQVRAAARFEKEYKKSKALGARYRKEGESHKVYGAGGKVQKSSRKTPGEVRVPGEWSD